MLVRAELVALTQWCHGHAIRWMPASVESGLTAMMLEVTHRRFSWRRMFLVLGDDEFSLVTERGETVAVASDLPAVLDTIGESAQPPAAPRPRAVASYGGFVV